MVYFLPLSSCSVLEENNRKEIKAQCQESFRRSYCSLANVGKNLPGRNIPLLVPEAEEEVARLFKEEKLK